MAEHYRSLTRTYRPQTFDDVVSQQHVSDTLQNAIKQNRLAHAYMFCGPRGVGKTTMARVLARAVNNIDQNVDGESLNQTLNVIEIDAASNNGVDDIRDLRERVRIPPQNGRYKIYIIDEVHMLSKSAFNALLKTLEEPPDHAIFIFATTEPQKVLPTILSRVQRFNFKRISIEQIIEKLAAVAKTENINIDDESLHAIAKKADGALRDALGLLDQAIAFCGTDIEHKELLDALNVVSVERMFAFMDKVMQRDAVAGLSLINDLLQEGYDVHEFLVGLTEHLRNLYVAKYSDKMYLIEATENTKKRLKETADSFTEDELMRMLYIVNEAQFRIKDASQPKVQFEITLLKLTNMERSRQLDVLVEELEELKKKRLESATAINGSGNGRDHSEAASLNRSKQKSELTNAGEPASEVEIEVQESNAVREPNGLEDNGKSSSNGYEHSSIFGETSLRKSTDESTIEASLVLDAKLNTNPKNNAKALSLDIIKENWEAYVKQLKQHVAQMLYFQMQRIEPTQLKNGELTLSCNDAFAQKMINEHKKELAKVLEGIIGTFLQFTCKVRPKKINDETALSPYERFKKLQKDDPIIKNLVELFGAELDYNL